MINDIKIRAKECLKNRWEISIGAELFAIFLSLAVSFIFGFIGGFFPENGIMSKIVLVIDWILGIFITIGLYSFFINIARNNSPSIEDIFKGFTNVGRNFCTAVITYITAFLLVVIPMLLTVFAAITFKFGFVFALTLILTAVAIVFICYFYLMTTIIMADNKTMKPFEIIALSFKLLKGNIFKFIALDLSFIGWYILCILTIGIGFIFIAPYVITSHILLFDDIYTPEKPIIDEPASYKPPVSDTEDKPPMSDNADKPDPYAQNPYKQDTEDKPLMSDNADKPDPYAQNPYEQDSSDYFINDYDNDYKTTYNENDFNEPPFIDDAEFESDYGKDYSNEFIPDYENSGYEQLGYDNTGFDGKSFEKNVKDFDIHEEDISAEIVCSKCGNSNPPMASYCNKCGSKLSE